MTHLSAYSLHASATVVISRRPLKGKIIAMNVRVRVKRKASPHKDEKIAALIGGILLVDELQDADVWCRI